MVKDNSNQVNIKPANLVPVSIQAVRNNGKYADPENVLKEYFVDSVVDETIHDVKDKKYDLKHNEKTDNKKDCKKKKMDLNGDGKFDHEDIKMLEEYLKGERELSEEELQEADVNGDGKVDYNDLIILIRMFSERRKLQDRVQELQLLYNALISGHSPDFAVLGVDNNDADIVKRELESCRLKLSKMGG